MRSLPLGLLLFAFSQHAWAAAAPSLTTGEHATNTPTLTPSNRGWQLFGGVGIGGGAVKGSEFSSTARGIHYVLNANATYGFDSWLLDAGVGWFYSDVNGSDTLGRSVDIRTRAALLEASPRMRLGQRWQLGPVIDLALGTDTGFAPSVGKGFMSTFIGARGVYESSVDGHPVRFWQQLSTDVGVSGRQIFLAMAGVQVGLPVGLAGEASAPARSERVSGVEKSRTNVHVTLDSQKIFFETNSARLKPTVDSALREVGGYLSENGVEWNDVEISGHADRRGAFAYNLKLSKSRARSVRDALVTGGIAAERTRAEGYSYSKPVDPERTRTALARNRRVELMFHDVKDPGPLLEKLKPLMELSPL